MTGNASEAPHPGIDTNNDVPMLRWPEQESERRRLAALGERRILILDPTAAPPEPFDDPDR